MERKRTYDTRQKRAVRSYLSENPDRYFTVEEIYSDLRSQGGSVGRTTVYRSLEQLADDGEVAKVFGPSGAESRFRYIGSASHEFGQLLCLNCGKVLPLDCHMLDEFSSHVRQSHGFAISRSQSVLYGYCSDCANASE